MTTVLERLASVCGDRHTREAAAGDRVTGLAARWVAVPGTPQELSGVVAVARDAGVAVVARGAATKLDWGTPPARVDILVDTSRLTGLHDHVPGEPVVTVGAGTSLRALQAALATAGQRVALDPASAAATV